MMKRFGSRECVGYMGTLDGMQLIKVVGRGDREERYLSNIYIYIYIYICDRLCVLVVRVSGYRYRGPGFDPRRYQIF